MADRDVGGIVGHLRLDKSDWDLALSQAGAKADDLSRKNPNIKVTATTGEALAQLEAVAVAAGRLQDAQGKVTVSQSKLNDLESAGNTSATKLLTARNALAKATRDEETAQIRLASAYQMVDDKATRAAASARRAADATKPSGGFSMSPLIGAAAIAGPAAVPLAAVGAGALLGLLPLAAAAALAFKGISNAMAAGGTQAAQYSATLNTLKSGVSALEQTAANGVMTAFSGSLGSVAAQFGPLNKDVAVYSAQLGKIAADVLPGVLALMHGLSPLFQTMGAEVERGAADFDKWANSSGAVSKFVAYVQTELPQVERTLADLSTTVSHLLQAFAPLGGGALTEIGLMSRAINAIPINVLQVLVPLVVDGYIAFKAYEGLSSVGVTLDKLVGSFRSAATAATEAGVAAEGAAAAEAAAGTAVEGAGLSMGAMLGPIGAVITGVGLLATTFMSNSAAAQQNAQQVDSLYDALQKTNGAIDDSIKASTQDGLAKAGLYDQLHALGLSYDTVTNAALGNKDALAQVDAATKDGSLANQAAGKVIHTYAGDLATAAARVNTLTTATGQATAATAAQAQALQSQANMFGTTTMAVTAATTATAQAAAATANTTLQMQLQNNAAGLLNQALQSLAGQNLNVAQAQTALDSAVLSGTATLQANKGSLDEHTQAGIADRQAIEGIASSLRAKAQADAAAGTSTEQVTAKYQANSAALLDQIGKLDGTKSAAYQYLQQLLAIPPVVKTEADLNTDAAAAKIAAFQRQLAALNSGLTIGNQAPEAGSTLAYAAGGPVVGPGTGTSDSIMARLSAGEFVMPAAQAKLFMPQLQSMRSGVAPAGQSAQVSYTAGGGSVAIPPMHITLELDRQVLTKVITEQQTYNTTRR